MLNLGTDPLHRLHSSMPPMLSPSYPPSDHEFNVLAPFPHAFSASMSPNLPNGTPRDSSPGPYSASPIQSPFGLLSPTRQMASSPLHLGAASAPMATNSHYAIHQTQHQPALGWAAANENRFVPAERTPNASVPNTRTVGRSSLSDRRRNDRIHSLHPQSQRHQQRAAPHHPNHHQPPQPQQQQQPPPLQPAQHFLGAPSPVLGFANYPLDSFGAVSSVAMNSYSSSPDSLSSYPSSPCTASMSPRTASMSPISSPVIAKFNESLIAPPVKPKWLKAAKFNESIPTAPARSVHFQSWGSELVGPQSVGTKSLARKLPRDELLDRRLCGILLRLTPDRFDRTLSKLLQLLDDSVQTQTELRIIVEKLLRFAITTPFVAHSVAKILFHLYDYLPRLILSQQYQQHLWDPDDQDIARTFRGIVVTTMESMFKETMGRLRRLHRAKSCGAGSTADGGSTAKEGCHSSGGGDTNCAAESAALQQKAEGLEKELMAMVEVVGSVYNMDLVHVRLIRKGLLDHMLPPSQKGPSAAPPGEDADEFRLIHIRALCAVVKSCGRRMDSIQRRLVAKYLDKITRSIEEIPSSDQLRAALCLNEVTELRANNWRVHRVDFSSKLKTQVEMIGQPLDNIMEAAAEGTISMEDDDEADDAEEHCDAITALKRRQQNDRAKVYGVPSPSLSPTPSPSPSLSPSPAPYGGSSGSKASEASNAQIVTKCYRYSSTTKSLVVIPALSSSVEAVDGGLDGSCYFLDSRGELRVSGNNKHGQLGIESEIIHKVLSHWDCAIPQIRDISALITRFVDGIKYRPDWVEAENAVPIHHDICGPDGQGTVRLISRGVASRHRFVSMAGGQLYGAGCNHYNQLGCDSSATMHSLQRVDPMQNRRRWQSIPFFGDNNISLRSIHCGYSSTKFLSSEGKVYTVGYSSFGNLGFGDKHHQSHSVLYLYPLRSKIEQIACGFDHTLALNEYRYVFSFGDNGFGQLGHGHSRQSGKHRPKSIEFVAKNQIHAVQVCCGAFHSVVVDCNGSVYCFGYNLEFQCHHSREKGHRKIMVPLLNTALARIGKVEEMKCGGFHNAARLQTQDWYLWGDNKYQQCLVGGDKTESVQYPTKYDAAGLPKGERIIDLFPTFDATTILATAASPETPPETTTAATTERWAVTY